LVILKTYLRLFYRSQKGNILLSAVIVMIILSMFGGIMVSRTIVDSSASAKKLIATRAFYLADAGIQWARKYLVTNTAATTLGPINYGGGTLTVKIEQTSIYLTYNLNNISVYKFTSTAIVGNTTRVIEEMRYRGGGSDKDFILWREVVTNEF